MKDELPVEWKAHDGMRPGAMYLGRVANQLSVNKGRAVHTYLSRPQQSPSEE